MNCDKTYIRNICAFILAGFILGILLLYTINDYRIYDFPDTHGTLKNPKIQPFIGQFTLSQNDPSESQEKYEKRENKVVHEVTSTVKSGCRDDINHIHLTKCHNLSDFLFKYPWAEFENSIGKECETYYRQSLIDGVQKFAFKEPLVTINKTCHPPPLLDPKDINCSDYPHAFRPNKYKQPIKVAHAIQLGFDADSLEIHLNEIYDVVDYFFILEATRVHCKILR